MFQACIDVLYLYSAVLSGYVKEKAMSLLELKNVSLVVDDGKELLKDITTSIDYGKLIVVTGPNGGGKSTLANTIMGIRKNTEGNIYFENEDISNMSITERANKGISFAFQQPIRFKGIKVHDLIDLAVGGKASTLQIRSALHSAGLCPKDYIEREVNSSLSGGEIKRIEIATAFARGTKLTLFDEPEAGIDIWSFQGLTTAFKELKNRTDGSIIIISHQERIFEIADEIMIMKDGRLIEHGKREDVLPGLLKGSGCAYYTDNRCCEGGLQ